MVGEIIRLSSFSLDASNSKGSKEQPVLHNDCFRRITIASTASNTRLVYVHVLHSGSFHHYRVRSKKKNMVEENSYCAFICFGSESSGRLLLLCHDGHQASVSDTPKSVVVAERASGNTNARLDDARHFTTCKKIMQTNCVVRLLFLW
jgi:hypothetical protein